MVDSLPAAAVSQSCKENMRPSEEFLEIFHRISSSSTTVEEREAEELLFESWKQYCKAADQVVLEGNSSAWIACAIFCSMVHRKLVLRVPYTFTMSSILASCGVSPLEFFDKCDRWLETVGGSKRLREQVHKVQGSLAVSAVVYKKFLPIFRTLFSYVDKSKNAAPSITSSELLDLIWIMFLALKKSLSSEDLLGCFHLLLCVLETVYEDVCANQLDEHVNQEFAQQLLDSEESVLEFFCHSFEGAVLDAKHMKAHWYNCRKSRVLGIPAECDLIQRHNEYRKEWSQLYETHIVRNGELDERMFLPRDAEKVFDPNYDCSSIEILRRGGDNSSFADAELLLRISTQVCLERLIDYKALRLRTPLTANSYVISPDQLCPVTPLSTALHNTAKLAALVPPDWTLQGSILELYCVQMRDNPLPTIALSAENYGQLFADVVRDEAEQYGQDYDLPIIQSIEKHQEMSINIFYIIMEKIARAERERHPGRENDFCNVFRKEEFLGSVFACVMELILFSYNSVRVFPWSIKKLGLAPIAFHKVVEVIIRAEPGLSRDMVKHLSRKEEEVLEELAWALDSPIWNVLNRRADYVPSCEQAWNYSLALSNSYSPVKRRKVEGIPVEYVNNMTSSTSNMFFRKVYYMSCMRLTDLCDRIRMNDKGKKLVWTLLEHVLRTETSLLAGRHLDQNLLCIVYIITKSLNMPSTFMDIMSHYRLQPQARSQVYREVLADSTLPLSSCDEGSSRDSFSSNKPLRSHSTVPTSSKPGSPEANVSPERVDLIKYYNKFFLPRVEEFVKRLDANDVGIRLLHMPQPHGFGLAPTKKSLSDRVSVVQLSANGNVERHFKFNIQQSPRKDLQTINRMVNVGVPASPYYSVTEVNDKASVFGRLYRR